MSKYVYLIISAKKTEKLLEIAHYIELDSVASLLDKLVDGLIKEYDDEKSFIRGIL